jgi:NTP pyrophosphatase (non-canonical NTP hydrolase)
LTLLSDYIRVSLMKRDSALKLVILGDFKKHLDRVVEAISEFSGLGVEVTSPAFSIPEDPSEDFILSFGEEAKDPKQSEGKHLKAIKKAHLLYLVNPEGRLGKLVNLELGYALAYHKPVFALEKINEPALRLFCQGTGRPKKILKQYQKLPQPLLPRLTARPALIELQDYLHQVGIEREFVDEAPKEMMLLLVKEVGELAKSLHKGENLKVSQPRPRSYSAVEGELADCLICLFNLANGLNMDLEKAFRLREEENEQRFWGRG